MIDFNDAAHPFPAPARYDLDAIVARLRTAAESWVPQMFPNGNRVGDEWRLANIKGAPPRKQGSCVIHLSGQHAGDWHDFDGGHGGGPLSAIEAATGLTSRPLFERAADLAGWSPDLPARQAPSRNYTAQEPATTREIAFIIDRAGPLSDSPVASYLHGRGLVVPNAADVLAHPDLTHWETKTGYSAMIGLVRDRAGEVVAVHRTYLEPDAERPDAVVKAAVSKPRMMLGKTAGGTVRLGPISASGVVALSEGIETGLAAMTAIPQLAVWATLSTSGLEQVLLPPEAARVIILADNDMTGAGVRAAEATAQRLRAEGREVAIAVPRTVGQDFNDLLLTSGPSAVRAVIEAALPAPEQSVAPEIGMHRPINYTQSLTSPFMRADEGDLGRAIDRTWSLLLASNRTPWLFRSAGIPTWIVPDDEGRPVAANVTDERLRHMLAKLAGWQRMNRQGELIPAHPPIALIKSLLATPDPGLPVLAGIVNTPVFGRNGKLMTAPGYHPDARLLYCPSAGFDVPAIDQCPSPEQRAAARALICEDFLGDFPFVSAAERAHAVALLLLGFLRAMIDGPTPLHVIEKPSPGTGGTLMVDAIATVLTGVGASVMTEGRDDEEWRKRITAKLRQIPSMVLIDNLGHKLDSSAVAAALTAPFWEDRILGASEMARLPIRCVWVATGNNPEFSNEMARRIVRIRLDAHIEQPWLRTGFKHPDLMRWVIANRARIVVSCLTLCQSWIAAGRPRGTRTIGSYENWSQIMGGVLEVAGIDGFLGNLEEMMKAADRDGVAWNAFIGSWWDRFGTTAVGTNDLFEIAVMCEPPLPLGSGNEQSRRTRLGKAVPRMRDRVFHVAGVKVRLTTSGSYQGARIWTLQMVEGAQAIPPAPDPTTSTLAGDPIRAPPISDQPACLSEVS